MIQQDPDEHLILVARRTIFGIIHYIIVAVAALAIYLYVIFQLGLNPDYFERLNFTLPMTFAIASATLLLIESVVYLAVRVYLGNTLTLTTESIMQHLQLTPFATKISQLGLDDIEDVTVTQPGFISSLLNYGTLTIETAGEQQNFIFKFAHNPSLISRAVIAAKEDLEDKNSRVN